MAASMNTAIESLYEEKRSVYHKMKEMLGVPHSEWSPEDEQKWSELDTRFDELKDSVEREEADIARRARLEAIEAHQQETRERDRPERNEMKALREGRLPGMTDGQTRDLAFAAWLRPGAASQEQRFAAKQCGLNFQNVEINVRMFAPTAGTENTQIPNGPGMQRRFHEIAESRAQATSPGSAGGYIAGVGMQQALEIAMLQFNTPRRYSSVVRAGDGRSIQWPTTNDSSNKGRIVGENAAATNTDVVFGSVETKPYLYSSDYVPVSIQLMQDAQESVAGIVGRLLGERIGRIQQDHFTTGTGVGQPSGLVTGATAASVAFSTDNTPTLANLIDLKHSVDPAYRMVGHGWVMPDVILSKIKQLVDGSGSSVPAWQPSLSAGEPDRIDGDPYFINQSMPHAGTTGEKCMAYGQLDKYKIHDALDVTLRRLDELLALNYQVCFLAHLRTDGVLLDAGTHPVKYATNP